MNDFFSHQSFLFVQLHAHLKAFKHYILVKPKGVKRVLFAMHCFAIDRGIETLNNAGMSKQ